MENALKHIYDVIIKIGLRKTASIISGIFWFVLPFAVWIQIYENLGRGFFIRVVAFPAIFIGLIYFVIVSLFTVQMAHLDRKLMKRIGSAKSLFDNPQDPESEKNFREECHKFVVPYLHYSHVYAFGLIGLSRGSTLARKVATCLFQTCLVFYLSYSTMTFFIEYESFLSQTWFSLSKYIPYSSEMGVVLLPFFQNPILSTFLVFLFSLLTTVPLFRRLHLGYQSCVREIINESFSVFTRVLLVAAFLIGLPWMVGRRGRTLNYAPFTFPTSLPAIIQESVLKIENKECNVSKWSYIVSNEGDIETLKAIIYAQKDIPWIIRVLCLIADPGFAFKEISKSKPILYMGTIDARCGIVGRIEYDPYEKMFRSQFSFDNRYVKEYFKSVAEIEIGEQKKLKGQLHPNISELIGKLGLDKDGDRT